MIGSSAGRSAGRVLASEYAGCPGAETHIHAYDDRPRVIFRTPNAESCAATRFAGHVPSWSEYFVEPPVPTTNCRMPRPGSAFCAGSCGFHRW